MEGQPSTENESSSCETSREAFPATVEPPWKRRRTLFTKVVVPGSIVGAGVLTLVLLLRPSSSGEEEVEGLSSTTWLDEGKGGEGAHRGSGSDIDATGGTDLIEDEAIWGEEDLDDPDSAPEAEGVDSGLEETDEFEDEEELGEGQPEGTVVFEGALGRGATVVGRLTDHGLDPREANEVVTALKGHFNFRRSRPRDTYRLELSGDDRVVSLFRYEAGPTEIYEVRRRGGGLEGRRVKVKTKLIRIRVGRRVKGSLAQAISASGLRNRVLRTFLRTFGSNINFQNDLREGDTFRVIADEERLNGEFLRYKTVWALEYNGEQTGRLRAFYFRPPKGRGRYYNERGESLRRKHLRTPCNYTRISSPFDLNRFHPILRRRVPHRGVDFAAPRGTPIWATADGTVRFAARKGANGNLVIIRHGGGLESIYAHLQKFARGLKRGQSVSQGQVIGYVGSTGRSTGPHLHFGLRKNGRFIDPMKYRSGPGPPIDPQYRTQFRRQARKLVQELEGIRIGR